MQRSDPLQRAVMRNMSVVCGAGFNATQDKSGRSGRGENAEFLTRWLGAPVPSGTGHALKCILDGRKGEFPAVTCQAGAAPRLEACAGHAALSPGGRPSCGKASSPSPWSSLGPRLSIFLGTTLLLHSGHGGSPPTGPVPPALLSEPWFCLGDNASSL